MSFEINVVTISGNLTRDPELRATPDGTSVCKLSIAHNESYKDGDTWAKRPHFFEAVVWGGQGEAAAKNLAKGSKVVLQGELQQRSWEAKDGTKRTAVEINVRNLVSGFAGQAQAQSAPGFSDDDIPL
jgi:single-strand DNA-binding protein